MNARIGTKHEMRTNADPNRSALLGQQRQKLKRVILLTVTPLPLTIYALFVDSPERVGFLADAFPSHTNKPLPATLNELTAVANDAIQQPRTLSIEAHQIFLFPFHCALRILIARMLSASISSLICGLQHHGNQAPVGRSQSTNEFH